jgi:hypothetical protein
LFCRLKFCQAKKTKHVINLDDDDSDPYSGWDKSDEEDDSSLGLSSSSPVRVLTPKTPGTPATRVKAEPATSSVRNTKRKSLHDQVQDLAGQDRIQRLKIAVCTHPV